MASNLFVKRLHAVCVLALFLGGEFMVDRTTKAEDLVDGPRQGAWKQVDRALAEGKPKTAIEALALYRRDRPATLTIVGEGRPRQERALREFAAALGVESHVRLVPGVGQRALARFHHASDTVLAPLVANDRNLTQGCCPLKVLEAMATGTPLVASNLPVVASLARNEIEALGQQWGSITSLADR